MSYEIFKKCNLMKTKSLINIPRIAILFSINILFTLVASLLIYSRRK